MQAPESDLQARRPVWDAMQMVWMDTDVERELELIAEVCARSKYSLMDLEQIYWNEVFPAIRFNRLMSPAPEWAGFDLEWLTQRILATHRFGRRLPARWFRPYARQHWHRLAAQIAALRLSTEASGD